jgi:branched-subunit amino acid ABC-type transport system permease component
MDNFVIFFSDHFQWINNPTVIFRQGLAGLNTGMLLFLISSGLSLIFGVNRVINFAHGALYMMGAYLAFTVVRTLPGSMAQFIFALFLAPIGVAALGVVFEVGILRRIYRSEHAFQLLVTFALVLILGEFVKIPWGRENHNVAVPALLQGTVSIGEVTFPVYRLGIIVIGLAVALGLWVLLFRTRWGMSTRAATFDRDMVDVVGVNVKVLYTTVFALGAGLAGLAGALAAPVSAVGPGLHATALIDAFIVVVIGGLGSVKGALVGALLVGMVNAFGLLAFPALTLVITFIFMAILLVVRPWGLMGTPE